jgi:hypothetical protein
MKKLSTKQRLGVMLQEAVIVSAVSSAIVLLGIKMLHQTMTLGSQSRTKIAFRQISNRLADQFRTDIHNASTASELEDGSLQIRLHDSTQVSYRSLDLAQPKLERRVEKPSGELVTVEQIRLLDHCVVQLRCRKDGFAILSIESVDAFDPGVKKHELRVIARPDRLYWIGHPDTAASPKVSESNE